jgi:hypothetical protein
VFVVIDYRNVEGRPPEQKFQIFGDIRGPSLFEDELDKVGIAPRSLSNLFKGIIVEV